MYLMKVNVHELEVKGYVDFAFSEPDSYFDIEKTDDETIIGNINGKLHFYKGKGGIVGEGVITFKVRLRCVNCLKLFEKEITVNFFRVYEKEIEGIPIDDERELTEGELDTVFFKGDEFVINSDIRDDILLAIPAFPKCSPDCRGLIDKYSEKEKKLPEWKKILKNMLKKGGK